MKIILLRDCDVIDLANFDQLGWSSDCEENKFIHLVATSYSTQTSLRVASIAKKQNACGNWPDDFKKEICERIATMIGKGGGGLLNLRLEGCATENDEAEAIEEFKRGIEEFKRGIDE